MGNDNPLAQILRLAMGIPAFAEMRIYVVSLLLCISLSPSFPPCSLSFSAPLCVTTQKKNPTAEGNDSYAAGLVPAMSGYVLLIKGRQVHAVDGVRNFIAQSQSFVTVHAHVYAQGNAAVGIFSGHIRECTEGSGVASEFCSALVGSVGKISRIAKSVYEHPSCC